MLPFRLHLHEKQNRIYAQLFGKCQDKSQIIKATTEHLKLNKNKPTGPAMLQDHKIKNRKQKSKTTHNSFNIFIKQLYKRNSDSVTHFTQAGLL